MRKKPSRRRGITLIWVAVAMLMLVAFMGMVTDTAYVRLTAEQLQYTADAAALAAARRVSGDWAAARQTAISIAAANTAAQTPVALTDNPNNDPNGDIVAGRFNQATNTFTPGGQVNAVKVVARRTTTAHGPLRLLFGPGVQTMPGATAQTSTSNITRNAIAMMSSISAAGMVVLNPTAPCALTVHGTNLTLQVNGGPIQVNSTDPCAVCTNGNPTIDTPQLYVTGGACLGSQATVTGEIVTNVAPLLDPLANLPAPSWNQLNDLGEIRVTGSATQYVTAVPGYYSRGITIIGAHGTITCPPGIYIVDGNGLNIGGGTFNADGALFYIVDTTPNNNKLSSVQVGGGAAVTIRPPDPDVHSFDGVDTYAGISFFEDRANVNPSSITGNIGMNIGGVLYFPSCALSLGGNSGTLGIQAIADTVDVGGSDVLVINYGGAAPSPPRVFLVH